MGCGCAAIVTITEWHIQGVLESDLNAAKVCRAFSFICAHAIRADAVERVTPLKHAQEG